MKIFKSGGKLHWFKNMYLRMRYGAGCCDVGNLDYYMAKKILPMLKRFKIDLSSYPFDDDIQSSEDWEKILDKMIWSLQYLVDGEEYASFEEARILNKKEQEGFELFGKYFRSLWQ